MSVARNFRITVNLSNFFHDHRNRARIFINDEIQTISDLEDRIEKIFRIQNFHLTSQNEFLPPSEDARILQKDDIIWVMQNGENYEPTCMPKISSKKASKKSQTDSRKRSFSLTDEYMEEERSVKKKKKKCDPEKVRDNESNLLNTISDEPKKKKKKKASDNPEEVPNTVNIETSSKLPSIEKKPKSKMLVDSSSDKLSTTVESLNSPKSNVMNINSLLPVLQSHIDTYNKKITSQLNKSTSYAEIPNSTVTKESDDEKTEYTCKGNLTSYKRNIQIPTITEEYLKQKKINIVKIEKINVRQVKMDKKEDNNKGGECSTQDIHGKKASNSQSPIVEDRVKGVAEYSKTLSDSIIKDLSTKTTKRMEQIKIDFNNSFVKATDITETKKVTSNSDGEKPLLGHDESNSEIIQNVDELPVKKITPNQCESKIDNRSSELNTMFIASPNMSLNITGETSRDGNGPVSKATEANSSRSSLQKLFEDNVVKNPNFSSASSNNTDEIRTPPAIKSIEESPIANATVNTERVVLRKPDTPFPQKYFFLKGIPLKIQNGGEDLQSIDCKSVKGKNKFLLDTSNIQIKKVSTEDVPNEMEEPNMKIAKSDELPQTSYSEATNIYEEKQKHSEELAESSDTNNGHDNTINETLPSAASIKMLKDITENIMEESKIDCSRDSDISEIDVKKDVSCKLDSSMDVSGIRLENTRFYKRKQQSGVGQLLEELRGNESVVSVESVESDCSDFVTKRHRKRVRRRKRPHSTFSDTSFNDSSIMVVEPPIKPKPLNVKAGPSIHIKFEDDEDGEGFKVTDVSKGDNSSYIENITLKSDLDESKIEKAHIKDEDILKSPSMAKMLPKVGDLIAFKILRITENYTPEISSYVTGKVIEFNTENKHIVYEILSGLDQCDEPTGKLSLDPNGMDDQRETGSNRREFGWLDLIDPRLLYP